MRSFVNIRFSQFCFVVMMVALMCSLPVEAQAAPADMDVTFGTGGLVVTEFDPVNNMDERAWAIALQPDGKVVAIGDTLDPVNGDEEFALARYNTDGTLDATFGTGGLVITDFDPVNNTREFAWAIALQPDGKIVAAGSSSWGGGPGQGGFALARYNADGTLDATFGTGGLVVGPHSSASAIALQPDGKIVAAGSRSFTSGFALARYNADGTLDATFGNGGQLITNIGPNTGASAMALQPDGKIVVAGRTQDPVNGDWEFALARYNPNGAPDATFGTGGLVITDFDPVNNVWNNVIDMALQPDGKIVVAGWTRDPVNGDQEFALARYNADGTLDAAFGTGGLVFTDFGPNMLDRASAVALQPDGKIVAAGETYATVNGDGVFALARYNTDGTLDATFGAGGLVFTDFNPVNNTFDSAKAMALQPDGKIVVAGMTDDPVNVDTEFALARYLANPNTPPVITMNGVTPVNIDAGTPYVDAGATAFDVEDGVITNIVTVNPVNTNVPGVYTVTYDVTDSGGLPAIQVTRTVNVNAVIVVPPTPLPGGGTVSLSVPAGASLFNVSTGPVPPGGPPGVIFPLGTVSFSVITPTVGASVTITLTFSALLPEGLVLYQINFAGVFGLIPRGSPPGGQWVQTGPNTINLTLTDGGPFDKDGVANGVIVDPLALGSVPPPPGCTSLLTLNAPFFNTGSTLTLGAQVVPWAGASTADAYVSVRTPGGAAIYLQLGGAFTVAPTPMVSNWTVAPFNGQIFSHTFGGGEPVGLYTVNGFFTVPGTFNATGPQFCPKTFTFTP